LASTMVQVCGIYSLQPPYTLDYKLFLLATHLCCVEVRMILEDADISLVGSTFNDVVGLFVPEDFCVNTHAAS